MKKDYLDLELYQILSFTPEASATVQNKIDSAYEQIRNNAAVVSENQDTSVRGKKRIRGGFYLGFAAALILVLGFLGFSNPVLAGKIPFIGRIFELVGDKVGYPGDFSENSVPISIPEQEKENADTLLTESNINDDSNNGELSASETDVYSQTVDDITITLSEASYTEMALYFSVELYSEEGFPEDFDRVRNMEDYILPYNILFMNSSQDFDFSGISSDLYDIETLSRCAEESLPTPTLIEGTFADPNTFLGIIRVDMDMLREQAKSESLPPEFTYTLTINNLWAKLNESKDVSITDPETGEVTIFKEPVRKYYEGPWTFTVPVSLNQTETQIREIMETNADGIGISKVTKTRYEIKADIILPENADPFDYIVTITDADGQILDSQGNVLEIYSVYGRNTDTVHVYVVDYYTFMDECKDDNAYLLPEKALYQTTIEW